LGTASWLDIIVKDGYNEKRGIGGRIGGERTGDVGNADMTSPVSDGYSTTCSSEEIALWTQER